MTPETYAAIMAHRDQFITEPHGAFDMQIAIMRDNDTWRSIVRIAREAGHKVTIRHIGKGEPDAEMHLRIN